MVSLRIISLFMHVSGSAPVLLLGSAWDLPLALPGAPAWSDCVTEDRPLPLSLLRWGMGLLL